ncbi:uncharacterized protein [Venturia canescens]|uniref:uncharacterized protein isoform X2 n=1 Tax=Venturia canescens TaxID=32260 RepID=UPI001C9C1820|nr:uncharacterized protein LOC122409626 isoform X2 [Venturia canescens]XP_043273480.1 uncharacterized protein LOC122409626 isoform X2 [Venturia canescens]XP_043273564.1 uncharacterized protein LOC122409626 isoform X2 [Venturia canescens]XP_043273650.1 uncharacterized protein LOC122409626 isoform X2 [Venturia canescens]XP_043273726.1 uncharacterized protein LOC122409626 isoform X2 [Venturia canescens]XP_043273799.1 uncharacterized protein LOC122409626 isoform X2 [Venturia canescens]
MSGFFNSLKSLASGAANAASSAAKYQGEEGEDTRMRFSLTPQPGESGFTQWLDAMKMVARLQGGIPPEFRKRLWLTLAERHLDQRGVDWKQAEKLCFNEWSNPDDEELGIQIVKDLHRTGCSLFCGAAGRDNQAVLRRVLLGFARWNKSVGYCQGLNVLAALVLQVTDRAESSAVKVMIYLIEGVLPEGYFADNLRGLSIDMAVFRDLLRMRLPKLSRHLEALQSDAKDKATGSSYEPPLTNVFTMQWFLTLFCHCLPQEAVLRVWDLIFLEGDEVLLRTALAIWEGISDRIMTVTSADEFYSIMGVLTREMLEFTDVNNLIKTIVNMGPLYGVTDLREKHRYNITPWARRLSDEEDTDTEEEERMAVAAAMFGVSQRFKKDRSNASSSALQTIGPTSDRERLALDISTLKHQYAKLRERQRQAHIILSAACARQSMVPSSTSQAMNHLLVGKSALVSAKTRQLGPPPGAIPPKPRVTATIHGMRAQSVRKDKQGVTLHWKDTKKSKNELEVRDETETPSSMVDSPETMSSSLTSPKRGSANDSDSDSTSTELCDEPDRLSDVDSEEPTSTSDCYVMATDDEKSPRPGQSPVIGVTPSCQFPDENSSDRHDAAYLEEEGYQKDPENNSKQLLTVEGSSSSIAMITDQIRRLSASDDNNLSPVSHVESVELDMKELDQKVGCGSEGADIGTDRTLENATRIVKDLTMLPVIPDTKESTQDGFCAMEKNFESLDRYNFSINSDNSGISETLMDSAISSATEYHEVIAMPVSSVATKNTDGSTDTIVNFGTANLPLNIETTRLESSSRETNDIFNYESTSISRASPEKTSLRLTDLVLSKCSKYENSISIASLNDNPTEKNIIERTFHPRSYVIGHLPISPTTVDDKLNTTCKIPPSTEKVRILKPETDSFLAGTSGSLDTNSKCIAQASISKENTDSSESLTKNNCPLDNLAASKRDNETCTSVSKGITSNETFSMNKRVPDTLESFSATSKPNDSLTYSDTSRQITQSLVNEPEVNVPKFSARSMTGKSERETRDVSSDYDFDVSINTISSEKNISQMIEKTVTVPMNEIPMTDTPSPIGSEVKTSELSSNYVYQDAMLTKFYEDKKKSPKTPESGKSYSSGETMGPDSRNSSLATSPRSITTDSRNILMDKSARSSFSSDSKTLTLRSLESESGVHNKTKLDIKSDLTRPSLENSSPSTPISTDSLKNKSEISPKFVISSSSESCSPGKANKSSERSFSSELQSPVSANSIKYRTNYADGQEHLSESPLDICSATSPFYPIVNPNQKTPSPYSTTEKQSTNGNSEETSPEQRSTGSKEEGNSSKYNVKSVSSGVTRCSDLNKSSKNNDEYDSGRPFEKELAETLSSLPCDKTKSERITSSHYREGSELDSYRSKEIVVEEKEDMEERYIEMDTVSPLPRDKYDANRPAFVDKSGSFKGLGLSESDGKYSVNTRENLKPFERSCSSLEKRFGKLKCSPSVEELIVDTHKKRSSDILQDIKHLEEKTLNDGTADTSMLTRKTGYGWEDLKNLEARRQDNFSDSASEFSRGRPDPSRISVFTEPRKSYVVEPKIDLDEGSESILKNYARKKSNGEPDDDSESKIGVWTKVKPRAGRDNGRRSSDRALKIIQENSAILHKILTCQAKKRLPDLEEISKEITISPINEEISKIFSPILEKMGLNEHEINEELARINFKDFDQMTTASGSVSEFDAKINDELSKLSLIDDTEIVDNMAVEDVISRDYLDTREALIDRQINEELSKLLANYEKDSPICVVGNRDEISSCQNPSEIEALDISSISTNVFSYPSSNESMEMKTDLDPMQDTGISGDKFSQYSEDPMMKFGKPSKYSLRSMSSKSDIDIYQELEKLDKISSGEILPSSASIIPQKIISPMSYPSECPVYPEVHPSSIDYSIKPADKVFESSPMKSPYDTYKPYDFKSRISPRKTPSNPYSARSYDKPAMDDHFDFHENPTSPSSLYDLGGTASSLLTKETLEFRVRYEDETSKAIRNDDFTLEPYHSSLVDFDRGASYYSNESPVSLKRLEAERNLEQTIVSPLNCSYKPPDLYTQKYDSASPKNYSYLKNPTEYETSYKVDEESVEAGSYLNPRRKNSHSLSPSYQYDARDFSASINHPYGTELSHNLDEASKRTFFHSEIPETMSQLVKCPENATSREALNYRKASLSLGPLDGTSTRISTCLETTPTPKSLFSPFPIRNSSRKPKELGLKLGLYSPSSPSSNPLKRS